VEQKEKFGAAHAALLALTAAFLLSLGVLSRWQRTPAAAEEGYAVTVERNAPAEQTAAPGAEPVNLNTATAEELQTLPGIGPVLAERIVDYRAAHGAFTEVEELLEVEGIGGAKLDALRGSVTLGEEKP